MSVDEFVNKCERKLSVIQLNADIRDGLSSSKKDYICKKISTLKELRLNISSAMNELKDEIVRKRSLLNKFEALRQSLMQINSFATSTCYNNSLTSAGTYGETSRYTPIQAYFSLDRWAVNNTLSMLDDCVSSMTPLFSSSAIKDLRAKQQKVIPTIPHLSEKELADVPSYLKGRFTCEDVNSAVDELNKVLKAKYSLLQVPRNKISDRARAKILTYLDQELPELKGQYFFVDCDVKAECNFKLDPVGKKKLAILRHCGRLREKHERGLVRYIVM